MQLYKVNNIWVKVVKNGSSNICGRQPLKNMKCMACLDRAYQAIFFKGCLPQVLLGDP